MNIYKIEIADATGTTRRFLGYAAAVGDYAALQELGFCGAHQTAYQRDNAGRDTWSYSAKNAVNCTIHVTKI